MKTASLRELNSNSSALARVAQHGETVVITDRGRPIADLVPHRTLPSGVTRAASDAMFRRLQRGASVDDAARLRHELDEIVDPYVDDPYESR
jgi:antitoxin (DNA-binding transcriptional repressor) of toxin-antitoxin stability system